MFERLFKLQANGTTVGREVRGGVVTFLTLSYIILVQPVIMSYAIHSPARPPELAALKPGEAAPPQLAEVEAQYRAACATYAEDVEKFKHGVFAATCVASAIACLFMAFLANYPVALAPAMGHNVFFAVTVCGLARFGGFGLTWQEALAANFISGIAFVLLSFVGLRRAVMDAVPDGLKYAIAVGIGFLIAFAGLQYGGVVVSHPAVLVQRGSLTNPAVLLTLVGLAHWPGQWRFLRQGSGQRQ
jgi:AGZA family xanthine/uracil permease-like MFS transporter